VVEKYRRGDGAQHLSVVFGCSPNTVIRAVKAALGPEEYERLKERRGRRPGQAPAAQPGAAAQGNLLQDTESDRSLDPCDLGAAGVLAVESAAPSALDTTLAADAIAGAPTVAVTAPAAVSPQPHPAATAEPSAATPDPAEPSAADASHQSPTPPPLHTATAQPLSDAARRPFPDPAAEAEPEANRQADADADADGESGPGVLAIDDADDFGEEDEDLLADDDSEDASLFVPVPLLDLGDSQVEVRPRPLEAADLPVSAYMLVDKTVELQPLPLRDISELGRLPEEELERRALLVYVNPRQAKRLCGRTQRVIKIPDTAVLSRTAPYLLAQGISRVVIEGALFALPGS